jgi:hypothetical protein
MIHDQHRRQLVGVERGLEVSLWAGACGPEAKNIEMSFGPRTHDRQHDAIAAYQCRTVDWILPCPTWTAQFIMPCCRSRFALSCAPFFASAIAEL